MHIAQLKPIIDLDHAVHIITGAKFPHLIQTVPHAP